MPPSKETNLSQEHNPNPQPDKNSHPGVNMGTTSQASWFDGDDESDSMIITTTTTTQPTWQDGNKESIIIDVP